MIPDLKELLGKFKENTCTLEELARLRSYFSDKKLESLVKSDLYLEITDFEPESDLASETKFERLFENIMSDINTSSKDETIPIPIQKPQPIYMKLLKAAAIIIPVFILGGAASYLLRQPVPVHEKVTYTEIRAPFGARTEIGLPDGSTVWLNAGSKIKYMNLFNKDNREILLNGEAYFKVAKNADLPFDVKTGDLSIKALGTEFNVKSYDDEDIIETTLVEGKISINQGHKTKNSIYLTPNQQALYVKNIKNLTVKDLQVVRENRPEIMPSKKGVIYITEKIDPKPIVAWKDNRLILKGEELTDLVVKLERKYDVKFVFASEELKQYRFTGTLENETLTQVLDVIKLSAPLDYKMQGKNVLIFENKQMTDKFSGHLKKK